MPTLPGISRNKDKKTAAGPAAVFAYALHRKNACKGIGLAFFESTKKKLCKIRLVQRKNEKETEKVRNEKILCQIIWNFPK